MPELPEVETIRRQLAEKVIGARIKRVEVRRAAVMTNPIPGLDLLSGKTITGVSRRGKWLWLSLEGDLALLFHLGMTGQLVWEEEGELPPHTHLLIELDRGRLRFTDFRRFGRVRLGKSEEIRDYLEEKLGPEPLSPAFSVSYLKNALARSRRPIKALLLEQKAVAGLGNIYTDEALFLAGIDPRRPACTLTEDEVKRLHEAIKGVLAEGIRHRGTSIRNYVDAEGTPGEHSLFLRVYGREGQPCPRCGTPIKKIKLSGRGTHFCPHCQH
ncbi:formamidopyrimidine-DNA glycosylase [Ammonifex degensii KC4]|uniref:Formamidopyrimidine-DNA glycosylase n=1 Tax=Ammonifex degensii (strain DSM 10501 / KC4) TaxID=429009 RepID=C9RD29_AMMDK|nr:DNA-formamidopyrimidine glycosylase [Ammonifex degensii]ACX52156.1 formamidopyrimidine-DNA glycosylase [Ammonifex degensii KC4]